MPNSFLSSLTSKQEDMQNARNPLNNNSVNSLELSNRAQQNKVLGQAEYTKQQQAQTGAGAFAAQQRKADQGLNSTPVASMLGQLGSFGLSLQAATNQFLSGQGPSDVNVSLAQGGTIDYQDGMWTPNSLATAVNANVDPLVAQKVAEQENLRNIAMQGGVFSEQGKAADFDAIMQKFADKNQNGVIDPDEQQWLNQAFDVANAARRLRELEPGSAQYEALMMQLHQMDKDGLVSGVMQALDEYDKLTGKTREGFDVVGADAETYNLADIMNMKVEDIRSQLTDATTGALGIFGADYVADIKRQVDEAALKYRKSAEEEARVNQELKDTSSEWIDRYKSEFENYRTDINKIFTEGAQDLTKDLDAQIAEATTKGEKDKSEALTQAKQWVVDLATGDIADTDFADVIYNFMSGAEGVAPQAQKIIKEYLGTKLDATNIAGRANLGTVLDKIAETGRVQALNPTTGQVVEVPIGGRQRMAISHIMVDDRMNDAQKANAVEQIIERASAGIMDIRNAKGQLADMFTPIGTGTKAIPRLSEAVGAFNESVKNTISTFQNSLARETYKAAKGAGMEGREGILGSMEGQAQEIEDSIRTEMERALQSMTGSKDGKIDKDSPDYKTSAMGRAEADIAQLTATLEKSKNLPAENQAKLQAQLDAAKARAVAAATPQAEKMAAAYGSYYGKPLTPEQTAILAEGIAVASMAQTLPPEAKSKVITNELNNLAGVGGRNLQQLLPEEAIGAAKYAASLYGQVAGVAQQFSAANKEALDYVKQLTDAKAKAEAEIAGIHKSIETVSKLGNSAIEQAKKVVLDSMTMLRYASTYARSPVTVSVDQTGQSEIGRPGYVGEVKTRDGKKTGGVGFELGNVAHKATDLAAQRKDYTEQVVPATAPVAGEPTVQEAVIQEQKTSALPTPPPKPVVEEKKPVEKGERERPEKGEREHRPTTRGETYQEQAQFNQVGARQVARDMGMQVPSDKTIDPTSGIIYNEDGTEYGQIPHSQLASYNENLSNSGFVSGMRYDETLNKWVSMLGGRPEASGAPAGKIMEYPPTYQDLPETVGGNVETIQEDQRVAEESKGEAEKGQRRKDTDVGEGREDSGDSGEESDGGKKKASEKKQEKLEASR